MKTLFVLVQDSHINSTTATSTTSNTSIATETTATSSKTVAPATTAAPTPASCYPNRLALDVLFMVDDTAGYSKAAYQQVIIYALLVLINSEYIFKVLSFIAYAFLPQFSISSANIQAALTIYDNIYIPYSQLNTLNNMKQQQELISAILQIYNGRNTLSVAK